MATRYHTGPPSDHFDGQRFFNRYGPTEDRTLRDIWRWKRHSPGIPWPRPNQHPTPTDHPPPRTDAPRVTLVGHASLLIQVSGCNILVDPVWSDRASPLPMFGPRRHAPPGIAFDDLPPIDVVLVTHSHYDHMDAPTLRRLHARHRPRLIAPLGNDVVLRAAAHLDAETADWGDTLTLTDTVTLALTPANHWSSRSLADRRRALWCGYALHTPHGLLYCAGDTAFADGALFRHIAETHGSPALAVVPIGAYEPRWFMQAQHMNPAEAVDAFRLLGARQAIGVHWGCFQLTDEARDAPPEALARARAAHGIRPADFLALSAGEVWQPAPQLTPRRG